MHTTQYTIMPFSTTTKPVSQPDSADGIFFKIFLLYMIVKHQSGSINQNSAFIHFQFIKIKEKKMYEIRRYLVGFVCLLM
jgi:hypothetical protein